ncbi:hypothetical protein MKW92_024149 [Papaver armeniacum]|nr:hypothetical protein MKW92_024149 [Papaver armeniacum]
MNVQGMEGNIPWTSKFFQHTLAIVVRILVWLGLNPNLMTITIKEYQGAGVPNQVFEAAETFLNSKVSTKMKGVELSKSERDKKVNISVDKRCIEDDFEGIHLTWRKLVDGTRSASTKSASTNPYSRMTKMGMPPHVFAPYSLYQGQSDGYVQDPIEGTTEESPNRFKLSFDKNHYVKVVESYIPYIIKKAKELNDANTTSKLCSSGGPFPYSVPFSGRAGCVGGDVNLQHPSTFQTLAMDPDLKKDIIDDLDKFVKRRDYYTKVGKAWKRSYLIYGPPGTEKSSLVAAMANYLNFGIYYLELTNVHHNPHSQLRSVLMGIKNRSIILIEDIDCSAETHKRSINNQVPVDPYGLDPYGLVYGARRNAEVTLSVLLNVIDGIWSSCGDEKIIIFTTNRKDKLDPALLLPGRMDKHIHMSYITPQGFRILASNYLSIDEHSLFGEIDELIQESETTPKEVAEHLMVSDDADISLNGLIQFLKTKILVAKQVKEEQAQKALDEEKDQNMNSVNRLGVYSHAPIPYHPTWEEEHYGKY